MFENLHYIQDGLFFVFLIANGFITLRLTISIQEMKIFMYENFVRRTEFENRRSTDNA